MGWRQRQRTEDLYPNSWGKSAAANPDSALYCFDSSALVKRYVHEQGRVWVRGTTANASGHRVVTARQGEGRTEHPLFHLSLSVGANRLTPSGAGRG
jgi:hypothetical protein